MLLEWPTVDLDQTLSHLRSWREREGIESVAGCGRIRRVCIGFGSCGLEVDSDGHVIEREFERQIRDSLNAGMFPQWCTDGHRSLVT